MNSPSFEIGPAPAPQKGWGGWFALTALLLFLILTNLAEYLQRPAPGAKPTWAKIERDTETALRTVLYLPGVPNMSSTNPFTGVESSLKSLPSDPQAAELRTVLRAYRGMAPLDADEKLLEKGDARRRSFLELHELENNEEGLSKSLALSKKFSKEGPTDQIARAVALGRGKGQTPNAYLGSVTRSVGLLVISGGVVIGLGLGALFWVFYLVQRLAGKWKPAGHSALPMTAPEPNRYAWWAFGTLFALFFGQVIYAFTLGRAMPDALDGLSGFLAFLTGGILILTVSLSPLFGREALNRIGINRKPGVGKLIGYGVFGWLANIPVLLATIPLITVLNRYLPEASHPSTQRLLSDGNALSIVGIFLAACVMAPIFEEIIFRGVMLPATIQAVGLPMGLILTNVGFAAIHPTGVTAWPALFAVGLTASLLAIQTRSLIPSMILHALHNFSVLLMVRVMAS